VGGRRAPANITTSATGPGGAVVTYTPPSAQDEGAETPSVSCSPASGSTFSVGTTTVTCTATDADDANSPVSATFTVTVTDADLALSGVPANITTNATGPGGAVVSYTPPTASDEGGQSPPVSCTPKSGSTFAIGTTTVTCTATASDGDDANSPVSGQFTVTVTGPLAQMQDLVPFVNGLPPGTSLFDKVSAAIADFQAGNISGTCSELTQLINQAKAKSGKNLTRAQANSVITAATRIRAVTGC
jgi:hypothetical protein